MKHTVASREHRPRPRQDRADQPEHADRLFRQGRFHGAGRRRQEQPVHDRAGQPPDDARARRPQGLRIRARRRAEKHRQSPGAVRLWLARRRRCAAGTGAPRRPRRRQPAPSSQAEARRDYELALQVGNKAALQRLPRAISRWLLREPRNAPAREDRGRGSRVAATEKAQAAEAERARLAAAGAQTDAQAKAEADAKAAEQARLAAEKAKQLAQDQAAEAERQRTETAAAAAAVKPATAAPSAEKPANLAALTPAPPPADVTRSVQTELRRVGCLAAAADGDWNAASQRSLSQFNRYAGTKFDTKIATSDALDAIKQKSSRVCPLVCEHGFKADGDQCSRIVCADGSFLNDDNECEKRRGKTPVANATRSAGDFREQRGRKSARPSHRHRARARRLRYGGYRPVQRGCHTILNLCPGGPWEGRRKFRSAKMRARPSVRMLSTKTGTTFRQLYDAIALAAMLTISATSAVL